MKKIFLIVALVILGLVFAYFILSSIEVDPVDKTVEIEGPSSVKSIPEVYAFGYQPSLVYSEERDPCLNRLETKRALFGDLHIHTALSADAFPDGTRTFPDDVYRFAKGDEILLPTPDGQPKRRLRLNKPLDFAAVTDHAETFGEGYICRTEGAFAGYHSEACSNFRAGGESGVREFMSQNARIKPVRNTQVCGENLEDCLAADKIVWNGVIQSAETAYDRSSECRFTSFVGYEYTRSINANHLHRNAIFRNADVPERPATHFSHATSFALLESYEQECRLGIEKCDVLSIPHNSNISAGNAFNPLETSGYSAKTQQANRELRNAYDRLMEITQHKGASECLNGVSDVLGDVDELCDVEAIRQLGAPVIAIDMNTVVPSFGRSNSPECSAENFNAEHNLYKGACLSSRDFARGALLTGMRQEQEHGVNPYEFGFIGSTDTHIGATGATQEQSWPGHIAYEATLKGRLGEADLGRFNRLVSNLGGLAGVYAGENSRDAIFQSMKRREAFGTSGTMIEPRFFAGQFDDNLCASSDWLSKAYATGTPMGSKLTAVEFDFQFLLQATADPDSKSLTKLQLIKGWIDALGQKHNQVIDVKVDAGAQELCAVFTDRNYNPTQASYYYLRAVEAPSLRWSKAQCAALTPAERPTECDNVMPEQIVEMAWTSPIWFTPRVD